MRRGAAAVLVVAAVLVAGCSPRPTVSQWVQSSGVIALDNTLVTDVHDVLGATKAGKPANEITTICDALYNDASQAYDSVLPSPDTDLSNQLGAAYIDLQNGGLACSTSVGGSSPTDTAHAYALIHRGSAELRTATTHMDSLGNS